MNPTIFSNLSPEDNGVIFELSQIVDIAAAERVTKIKDLTE